MILPNNPRIDPAAVEQRVREALAHRRDAPLAAARQRPPIPPSPRLPWRQRLKRVPLLGTTLVFAYRRWRQMTAPGIGRRERLKAVPVLGDLAYFLWVLKDLPRFRLATALDLDAQRLEHERSRARVQALEQQLQAQQQAHGVAMEQLRADWTEKLQRMQAQNQRLEERLSMQSHALRLLEQRPVAGVASTAAPSVALASAAPAPSLGNFYLEFETRFRGTPASVKERQRPYLPYVHRAVSGHAVSRAVDIGCGRGEWLELLREEGLSPQGIDLDSGMVLACQDRGFDVRQGDGIAWLQAQPAGSFHVVSAFQVIEHLDFAQLVALLDAALHALAPGGVAIFETPNPENLIVGACNFYYDPTHRHPIPPPVAAFIAEQRGFPRVEILRLNPYPESSALSGGDANVQRLNGLLYGPQDYALIVGKPHENA